MTKAEIIANRADLVAYVAYLEQLLDREWTVGTVEALSKARREVYKCYEALKALEMTCKHEIRSDCPHYT